MDNFLQLENVYLKIADVVCTFIPSVIIVTIALRMIFLQSIKLNSQNVNAPLMMSVLFVAVCIMAISTWAQYVEQWGCHYYFLLLLSVRRGMLPSECDKRFLDVACRLDRYGMDFHPVFVSLPLLNCSWSGRLYSPYSLLPFLSTLPSSSLSFSFPSSLLPLPTLCPLGHLWHSAMVGGDWSWGHRVLWSWTFTDNT